MSMSSYLALNKEMFGAQLGWVRMLGPCLITDQVMSAAERLSEARVTEANHLADLLGGGAEAGRGKHHVIDDDVASASAVEDERERTKLRGLFAEAAMPQQIRGRRLEALVSALLLEGLTHGAICAAAASAAGGIKVAFDALELQDGHEGVQLKRGERLALATAAAASTTEHGPVNLRSSGGHGSLGRSF